ncbi:MAG TPA: DUF4157 domain-containing protein [Polyangium sp.]|nr:DUF4157 domain-containing protein [Polyangium sp.]
MATAKEKERRPRYSTPSSVSERGTLDQTPRVVAQRQKMARTFGVPSSALVHERLPASLPARLTTGIAALSGMDLSDVRLIRDSSEPARMQAEAMARRDEIHLAPGQDKHLPHEAWHIVQQRQGRVKPNIQERGVEINDDPMLEREATEMGERAMHSHGQTLKSTQPAPNHSVHAPVQMVKNWRTRLNEIYATLGDERGEVARQFVGTLQPNEQQALSESLSLENAADRPGTKAARNERRASDFTRKMQMKLTARKATALSGLFQTMLGGGESQPVIDMLYETRLDTLSHNTKQAWSQDELRSCTGTAGSVSNYLGFGKMGTRAPREDQKCDLDALKNQLMDAGDSFHYIRTLNASSHDFTVSKQNGHYTLIESDANPGKNKAISAIPSLDLSGGRGQTGANLTAQQLRDGLEAIAVRCDNCDKFALESESLATW